MNWYKWFMIWTSGVIMLCAMYNSYVNTKMLLIKRGEYVRE
jgi:uncharacterized membrane protein